MSFIILLLIFLFLFFLTTIILKKKMQYWFFSYAKTFFIKKNSTNKQKPTDIIFCLVDHFEPSFRTKEVTVQKSRVDRWLEEFPLFSVTHRDGDGCMPKHTWFFSPHEDTEDHLERLTGLCKQGYGEIELHMHHDRILPFPDTSETFERKIREATDRYALLGLFGKDNRDDKRKFGFVHGDWALDNSRGGKFCGINNELQILAKCGCYADFTFPSICESQPQKINSIYYAFDDPRRPKSYDRGISVKVGKKKCGDLMIIQGPLGLHSKPYRRWPFIAIESANISLTDLPYPSRVDFWAKTGIGVEDKQEWIFIKVHTHGAYEPNADVLLGEHMHTMHSYLESKYNDGINFRLHYVTARELYNIVKAAESGEIGNPSQFRDYYIDKPPL